MTIATLRPTSNSTYVQLRLYAGADHWIAESDQLDSTYVGSDGVNEVSGIDTFACTTFSPGAGAVISNVRVYNRYRHDGFLAHHGTTNTYVVVNGVDHHGTVQPYSGSWANGYTDYANNPTTGAPWTISGVNGAEFGVSCGYLLYLGGYLDTFCAEVWVEVTYTVPSVAVTKGDGFVWIVALLQRKPKLLRQTSNNTRREAPL